MTCMIKSKDQDGGDITIKEEPFDIEVELSEEQPEDIMYNLEDFTNICSDTIASKSVGKRRSSRIDVLKNHTKTHTGDEPFDSPVCDQSHPPKQVRPKKECPVCHKQCKYLSVHLKVHGIESDAKNIILQRLRKPKKSRDPTKIKKSCSFSTCHGRFFGRLDQHFKRFHHLAKEEIKEKLKLSTQNTKSSPYSTCHSHVLRLGGDERPSNTTCIIEETESHPPKQVRPKKECPVCHKQFKYLSVHLKVHGIESDAQKIILERLRKQRKSRDPTKIKKTCSFSTCHGRFFGRLDKHLERFHHLTKEEIKEKLKTLTQNTKSSPSSTCHSRVLRLGCYEPPSNTICIIEETGSDMEEEESEHFQPSPFSGNSHIQSHPPKPVRPKKECPVCHKQFKYLSAHLKVHGIESDAKKIILQQLRIKKSRAHIKKTCPFSTCHGRLFGRLDKHFKRFHHLAIGEIKKKSKTPTQNTKSSPSSTCHSHVLRSRSYEPPTNTTCITEETGSDMEEEESDHFHSSQIGGHSRQEGLIQSH